MEPERGIVVEDQFADVVKRHPEWRPILERASACSKEEWQATLTQVEARYVTHAEQALEEAVELGEELMPRRSRCVPRLVLLLVEDVIALLRDERGTRAWSTRLRRVQAQGEVLRAVVEAEREGELEG